MLNAQTWYGYLTNATSTNITITDYYTTAYYSGYGFVYSGSNVVGGTLTGYSQYYMGSLQGSITGLSVSAPLAASYIQSNNLPGLFSIALGGNDYLDLSNYDDLAVSYGGNDTIYARGGNDDIWGGEGADTIDWRIGLRLSRAMTSPQPESTFDSTPVEVISGEATGDLLTSVEDLIGSAHADFLVGDAKGNFIEGRNGSDLLFGQSGDDHLYGGDGNDVIFGGLGNDIIYGDAGVDIAGFVGFSTQYSIGFHGQTVNGPEGSDQLTDIENIQFADGRMVYDQGDAAAIAYRMYDSAFGRAPDSAGQNGWTTALQKGLSVADMASGFAASPEFVATYGPLNNQQFVEQLYRNVLDREGEAAGVAGWTNALNTHAMSRGQVLAGFSELNEHVQKLAPAVSAGIFDVNETAASVARLYDATFNRLPDGNGLLGWKDAVDHGMSLSTVADGFAFSAEFQNTYGNLSNQGFVEQLYHNVLDRTPKRPGSLVGRPL